MGIQVSNVSKSFDSFLAIDDISLEVPTGSLVALLGPSGCGKSTLLRMIAGLEVIDRGRVVINGRDATRLSVQERQVGFVFQHFALFKHRSVRRNIAFGLELRGWSKDQVRQRVEELLDLVQLQGYGHRYPSQLSGGQRQRVSLARALAVKPDVLLLDEPFSALDAKVRKELRHWLRNLQDQTGVTTVIVTHDQEEAMEVADTIVVMNEGRIEQIGSPAEIYDHPASPFVMRFVGEVNVLDSGFVRPHDLELLHEPHDSTIPVQVKRLIHLGKEVYAELLLEDGQLINAQLPRERYQSANGAIDAGQRLHVLAHSIRRFDTELTGAN
ncbi:TOBE-like domain-containing protein [Cyanobium sp. FGCU-6]|nr:TOBE-like domain-containing protein [Cyanobium sp. FGCU6]